MGSTTGTINVFPSFHWLLSRKEGFLYAFQRRDSRVYSIRHSSAGCEEQNGDVLFQKRRSQLEAIFPWHHDIQKCNIDFVLRKDRSCLCSVFGSIAGVSCHLQMAGKHVTDRQFIISKQNTGHLCNPLLGYIVT